MTYKNALGMITQIKNMTDAEKEAFATINKVSADNALSDLRKGCYFVDRLRPSYMRTLRKELTRMDADELKIVESINKKSIEEINDFLDSAINASNEENRKIRAFNKAWKIKEQELMQQLRNEGSIQDKGAYSEMDLFTYFKRKAQAREELAKEMGLL